MGTQDEISVAIRQLGDGDDQALEIIWQNYFSRLVSLARKRLASRVRRSVDEEDVVVSAMFSFCRGMEAGKFPKIEDRNDLWKILVTLTSRKACSKHKYEFAEKRGGFRGEEGGHRCRGESMFLRFDPGEGRGTNLAEVAVNSEPTDDMAAEVVENCSQMLQCLDETSRKIALLALEGHTQSEIAKKVGLSREAVNRKIARTKKKWLEKGYA